MKLNEPNTTPQIINRKAKGRPEKPSWDLSQIMEFGMMNCSIEDMTAILQTPKYMVNLEMTKKTTKSEFRLAYERGQALIRLNLSKAQIDKALEGNVQMLMYLGKHILNQTDDKTEPETVKPKITEIEFL